MRKWIDCTQLRRSSEGVVTFPFIQKRIARSLQILMYHGVSDDRSPYLPTTPIQVFANHMQYLSRFCHVLDLHTAVERMKERDLPERAVVVTLDDGYRDNYLNVFPILKQLGLPATIFLATGVIGTGQILWHDQVCRMISETSQKVLNGFGSHQAYDVVTLEGKLKAQEGILWYLRSLEEVDRAEAVRRLSEQLEVSEDLSDSQLMLSWREVKDMYQGGVRFGAHTVTHPILSKISLDTVVEEIRQSRRAIEQYLGDTITTFAYPSGRVQDYSPEIKEIVKQEGFSSAVSTMTGANDEADDLFELKRVGFWDQDIHTFALRFEQFRFCA